MAGLAPGQALGGRFTVHGRLGQGGTAVVYLARDALRGEDVALKVVHPHLADDPAVRRRLRREVEAGAALAGAPALSPHDLHEIDGQLFLSMPVHPGRTLTEHVAARGPLPAAELEALARRLGEALARAHAAGLLHRDLSPNNVMLDQGGQDAVLMDFGLAARVDATRSTGQLGTAGYAAPELWDGGRADARADLYALGACLRFAATGVGPLDPRAARPLEALRPDLPPALRAAIGQLTEPDPARRPPGAAALRELWEGAAPAPPPAPLPAVPRPARASAGTHTVILQERDEGRGRRAEMRARLHRAPRDDDGAYRFGLGLMRKAQQVLGISSHGPGPEELLMEDVGRILGQPPPELPPTVWDPSFRLVDAVDGPTAERLADAARRRGFRADVARVGPATGWADLLARWFWVPIAVGWSTFPFALGMFGALAPSLMDVAAPGVIGGLVALSIVLPVYAKARGRPDPRAWELPVALPDLRPAAAATPEAPAAAAPPPTAPLATAPLATAEARLQARAEGALDALEAAVARRGDALPAAAVDDLRRSLRELRRAAAALGAALAELEAARAAPGAPPAAVAALQARLDRLRALDQAGRGAPGAAAERAALEAALARHADDEAAQEALDAQIAVASARLLEIASAAAQTRRSLAGAADPATTAGGALQRLQAEARAATAALPELADRGRASAPPGRLRAPSLERP